MKHIPLINRAIEIAFYLLFLLLPLVFTMVNYELFEFNKMLMTYIFTVVIAVLWGIKMILENKFFVKKTPLDVPLILFLGSQVVSTIFSIDRHVSLFGYYSRFNGGLFSTISYITLFYAFVTNFPKERIGRLLKFILASGFLVAGIGVLEHLGIDKNLWVQDVQNRVFSTLGQPNWLAAYLTILIPVTLGITFQYLPINKQNTGKDKSINVTSQNRQSNLIVPFIYFLLSAIFFLALIFTKSRSGFIAFWLTNVLFWLFLFFRLQKKLFLKLLISINSLLIIFMFFFQTPFAELNRFSFQQLTKKPAISQNLPVEKPVSSDSVIDIGVTESGDIRKIVWKGATDIFRHYPLFGTGVETFAFAYYKYRPVEHNMTSEWDFLYNKAHNEYLNYAATTGIFGLGSYFLFILVFIIWGLKKIKSDNSPLMSALITGWLTILITNFFGFSVVLVQVFFFLLPAVAILLTGNNPTVPAILANKQEASDHINNWQKISVLAVLLIGSYLLYNIGKLWQSDYVFAQGYNDSRAQNYLPAYNELKKAISINPGEPLYYDEFSYPAAMLSTALFNDNQSTLSAELEKEAVLASTIAVTGSPNNVTFWKTRTRVFYSLSAINEKYLEQAVTSLEKAIDLSPTDPKLGYNLGVLYDKMGKKDEALALLEKTTRLKPDYKDSFLALGVLYQKYKENDKAREMFNYVLTKIDPNDEIAKEQLKELK